MTWSVHTCDCLEFLKTLPAGSVDAVVTDPVWPNAHPDLIGSDDPYALFERLCAELPDCRRLLVWLGVQSDPRFLRCVPARLPFLRSCYLSRAVPGYNGRCLVTGDMLYAFGEWPASAEGARVIPGECRVTSNEALRQPHPCARSEQHARWVINWWTRPGETVFDPFCGSGTTGVACVQTGRNFIGVEIEKSYAAIARRRIAEAANTLWTPAEPKRSVEIGMFPEMGEPG